MPKPEDVPVTPRDKEVNPQVSMGNTESDVLSITDELTHVEVTLWIELNGPADVEVTMKREMRKGIRNLKRHEYLEWCAMQWDQMAMVYSKTKRE